MNIKNGAKVFIKNKKLSKYLFFLRDNKPSIPNPNMWGILGGAIEDGEKPIEALEREIKEESNIKIYNIKELGRKVVMHIIKNGGKEQIITGKEIFVFLAETKASLSEIELYEGQRLEYFTIEEALNQDNLALPIREIIIEFKKKLL
ncbi:MAG: NUDIX domain-containing protein [Candidatus Paceibacterota bacterium]|jgi:8-oxo-dGTP diphosphatase